jgi:hypothetical protein
MKPLSAKEAKLEVLRRIAAGEEIIPAMNAVSRKEATYFDWRKTDPEFRRQVDEIRQVKNEMKETGRPAIPPFDVFCRDYLHQPLHPHQLRMWDAIEGRVPRDLHDSMTFEQGEPNRILINVPPEHAKSTTFTVNYTVHQIHLNPDVRIVLMSNSKNLAKQFLYEVKQKLTNPMYREMHLKFAPEGGWKDPDNSWSADAIYVKGGKKTGKDPTVQALGWGGSIYGTRSDIIFMDDVIITKNANEYEKQMLLLDREVESRLPSDAEGGGLLAILGTRVSPTDLYRQLTEVRDHDDNRVWTYFRQPAVLDFGDGDSSTWTTLWPAKWPGKSLAKKKRGDAQWALIYQQLNVSDEMTFAGDAVSASISKGRLAGVLNEVFRPEGMQGLYLIGGLDPATVNFTSMVVMALDPTTGKRWVLDGFNKKACTPELMRQQVKFFTDKYHINEWVIERNAFQRFLTQDPELTQFLRSRGCILTEHYTTDNKFDSDFGIATMAPLFESCRQDDKSLHLISLPSTLKNSWCAELHQQLVIWEPQGMSQKAKTDLVMALWFCEIAAKKILGRNQRKMPSHRNNPFTSAGNKRTQRVISLADIRRQKFESEFGEVG